MAVTYKALALFLSYPTEAVTRLAGEAMAAIEAEALLPARIARGLRPLARRLAAEDLYALQEEYVWLFDRTRSLCLNLYEHVHGESRERGQAMVALVELYRARGLEPGGDELPDHLPVFLEFLSLLAPDEAASLLGEAAHVLAAIGERLHKRASPYRAVFGALAALSAAPADRAALASLLAEPDNDPDDLAALDKLWAEAPVTFGPAKTECSPPASLVRDGGRARHTVLQRRGVA